ncbi:MAG: peptidoglycan DD-metalloendopeptidase family protein [Xenococcaceae cyanobacterium]
MKDAFMQKVKPVLSCPADSSSASAKLGAKDPEGATGSKEGHRRARTSAAMIGLAISMGATGMLLPSQDDKAMAGEPVPPEPILTSFSSKAKAAKSSPQPEVAVNPAAPVAESPASKVVEPAPPVIKHKVKKGETLWNLSQNYKIEPEAIAASNKIEPKASLLVGQTLKIPPVNDAVHEVKADETVEKPHGLEQNQLQSSALVSPSGQLAVGESVTIPGQIDNLLQLRQNNAVNILKEKRKRLRNSVAELWSEESNNKSDVAVVPRSGSAVTQPLSPLSPEARSAKLPQITASYPEVNGTNSIEIPVPLPETVASPTPERLQAADAKTQVYIPVLSSETAASPTPERLQAADFKSPVPILIPLRETVAFPNSEQQASKQAPEPIVEIQQTKVTQALPQLDLPQPTVLTPPANQVYRVKPGDTLNSIARRYGMSRSELAQANNIRNPNLIKVNQELIIPGTQLAGNGRQTQILIPAVESVRSDKQSQVFSRQNQPIETQVQSQTNSHLVKLREDIVRLQQEYPNRREISQEATIIAIEPVTPELNNPVSVPFQPLNPEWEKDRLQRQINPELRFNQPSVQSQKQRQPLLPVLRRSRTPARASSRFRQGLIGTAPIEVENYNQMLRTPVGETVGPELPPLSSPDQYLPHSPARFNGYIWPTKGVITSGYGRRWGRMHKGVDIAGPIGTPIISAAPGEVVSAGWNSGGYGNLVKVKHPDGSLTLYAHNSRILVRRGQRVDQGQQIAEMGSTGYSTGPHLHFEVHPAGRGAVNPMAYLPKQRP